MNYSDFTSSLKQLIQLDFELPDGSLVPRHFHLTEAGLITKHYIDCGGTVRQEYRINLQLWVAEDLQHRLTPEKALRIMRSSEKLFGVLNPEVEIEYQGKNTIERYGLTVSGEHFVLKPLLTACLAEDQCGIPAAITKVRLSEISTSSASCTPGGGCC
jgi:hypothetical protein